MKVLLNYSDVIFYRVYANLKAEAGRTYLGYLWWFLEPLINTSIFYLIFVVFLQKRTENYVAFLLVGTLIWQWFQSSISLASASIISKAQILQQVYMPKYVFPLVAIFTCAWKFGCVFIILILGLCFLGLLPGLSLISLPILLSLALVTMVTISFPLALILPYFPDGEVLIDSLLRAMMLISGVFFQASQLPADIRYLFYLNPFASTIEAFREVLIMGTWPQWHNLMPVFLFNFMGLPLGFWMMRRLDRHVPKVLAPR